ncbi:MAG: hypothetical protein RR403_03990 [Pseudoflavonifractor sp.]
MIERIFLLAKSMGHVAAGDEEVLRLLCQQAEAELRGRLREGVTAEDCEPAFRVGAAFLALAGLCAAEREEQFTAGNVSIQRGKKDPLERGLGLRANAWRVMGPYVADDGFAFRGVRG